MRSPFAGLRSAWLEFRNFRASGWLMFSICAIALIPFIYAGLFLLAFLDPYGSLSNVPAAVVNLDEGAEVNGEFQNVGEELCDELVQNNKDAEPGQASGYKWTFVDREEADRGLDDATYYMELIIPKDFTKNIASASTSDPQNAELQVYFNPSTNLIAQTVGSSMVTKIKAELNNKVEEKYFDNIFLKIEEAGDGFQEASDGSGKLKDGLQKLEDGSDKLSSGISSAKDGSETIHDKLGDLTAGAEKVDAGVNTLAENLKKLDEGVSDAQKNSAKLSKAILGVADSLQSYQKTQSSSDLAKAKQYAAKAEELNSTIGKDLNTYVSELITSLEAYQSAAAESAAAKAEMDADQKKVMETVAKLRTETSGIDEVESAAKKLDKAVDNKMYETDLAAFLDITRRTIDAIDVYLVNHNASDPSSLKDATKTLIADVKAFEVNLTKYQESASVYQEKATVEAHAGADASEKKGNCTGYLMGVKNTSAYASKSTQTVADAVSKLYKAVSGNLADGTRKVADGSSKLQEGAGTLADGLGTALDGSNKITLNLGTAKDGADELSTKLGEGADKVEDNLQGKDSKVSMMSEPVTANGEHGTGENITTVSNYGTGFAPYFIGLGMWVGCLMITFLIRSLNSRLLMSRASSFSAVLSSYVPMVAIAWIQVIILLTFIQFGLGFSVNFVPQYYLFGLLVACCFVAICQFFRAAMGTSGMVAIVILLMLQLCTAAGTFPIEAEIPIFNILNPLLPMTYVVQGFRMAMCGLSAGFMIKSAVVLLGFTLVFLFLSTVVANRMRRVSLNTMYPKIQMVH